MAYRRDLIIKGKAEQENLCIRACERSLFDFVSTCPKCARRNRDSLIDILIGGDPLDSRPWFFEHLCACGEIISDVVKAAAIKHVAILENSQSELLRKVLDFFKSMRS